MCGNCKNCKCEKRRENAERLEELINMLHWDMGQPAFEELKAKICYRLEKMKEV